MSINQHLCFNIVPDKKWATYSAVIRMLNTAYVIWYFHHHINYQTSGPITEHRLMIVSISEKINSWKWAYVTFWMCLSSTMKEVEADKLRLTPQYLELKFIEAISNNTKIYFGNKVSGNSLYHLLFRFLWFISLLYRSRTWFSIKGCSGAFYKML